MSFPDPHLQPLLNGLIESGKRLFVINLSDVSYMDSYGIGDLIIAYNATKAAGGRISLLRPVPNVKKSLEITTKTTFQIFDEEAAAVKSVRAAG
jgi:anti-sigma B factor antagonist